MFKVHFLSFDRVHSGRVLHLASLRALLSPDVATSHAEQIEMQESARAWTCSRTDLFMLICLCLNRSIMLQIDGTVPRCLQIYRGFRNEILTRTLAAGERVPSTRALAGLLKVSRNTAVLAYEQLLAEGYLETRKGAAGTVVAAFLPPDAYLNSSESLDIQQDTSTRTGARLAIAGRRILKAARAETKSLRLPSFTWELVPPHMQYDFRPGRAAFGDLPYALWCRLLGARARHASLRDLDYGPPQGRWELREATSIRLRRLRGVDASPDRVVIVNGTQQALDLVSRVLLNPGGRVLMEEPHYTGARSAFMSAGAELVL